jgi:hypothetical protein
VRVKHRMTLRCVTRAALSLFSIQFREDPCTRFPVKACVGPPWPRIPTNFRKEISTSHSHRGRRDQARSTRSEKGNPHVLVLVPKICNPHGLHLGYLLVMGFVFLASMPFCMRFSKFSCTRSIGLLWPVTVSAVVLWTWSPGERLIYSS